MTEEEKYWTTRYQENLTGWDIGYAATPLKTYVDQLESASSTILIPGAGNAYEASYLWQKGFKNVHVLDISQIPLQQFAARHPDFPKAQIHQCDFFKFKGQFDLILEQTFFCSMLPTKRNRAAYAKQMYSLLKPNGKLVGLWFDVPLKEDQNNRPFGGTKEEYLGYLVPYFKTITFNTCFNSIKPRQDRELFGIFKRI